MKAASWFITIVLPCVILAQTRVVEFSTFSMGFDVVPSQRGSLTSIAGQQLSEHVVGSRGIVQARLLNSLLVRGTLTLTAVKPESAVVGYSLGLKVILPRAFVTSDESLYYRKGGERRFAVIALQRSGDTLRATVPAEAVSIRGLEYFIRLNSLQGVARFPAAGVDTIRVRFETFSFPIVQQRRTYRMVSVAVDLIEPAHRSVLEDDLGPYNPSVWRLFRWQRDHYEEYPRIAAQFRPGNAFWLITQNGGGFDIDHGTSVSTIQPATIVLDTGWNQIASPFAFRIDWDSLIAQQDVSPAYFYDGVSPYQLNIRVLEPWEGYFVENRSGRPLTLAVLPIEAATNIAESKPVVQSSDEYIVQIEAQTMGSELRDRYNFLGFKSGATREDDRLDLHEPPPIGDHLQLSIVEGKRFAANFKPFPQDGEEWNLELSSNLSHQTVLLHVVEYGHRPDGLTMVLLDKDEFVPIALQGGSFVLRTGEAGTPRSWKMLIGTDAFVAAHSGGIPLVPIAFALHQNWPNPFNPSTVIRYQLSKRSNVRLDVFNALGQLVKTLVEGEQTTGVYTVPWDGTNAGGVAAASGMYVYRLRAGEFTASRKMLLIR